MINLKKILIITFLTGTSALIYYVSIPNISPESLNFDEDMDLFNNNLSEWKTTNKNKSLSKEEWSKKYNGKILNSDELAKLFSKLTQPTSTGNNWVSLSSLKTFCNNKNQIGEGIYETFEYLCTKLSTLYS